MALRSSWITPQFLTSSNDILVTVPAGAVIDDIAVVGMFMQRPSDITVTPPAGQGWTAGPVNAASARGQTQTFWKRVTSAETGTWDFGLDLAHAGAAAWSGLWSGRAKTGSPLVIATANTVDRVTQTATTGTATAGDDVLFGFEEFTGVAETVTGFVKAQENAAAGMHLFTADAVAAGSVSVLPSPAASTNTYWNTLISLKAGSLAANAGPDQAVNSSTTVTLAGSQSGGASPYTYTWTQTGGTTTVTLSSSTAQNPTFTAPSAADTLTFSLVVTDHAGTVSGADTVIVSVAFRPVGTPAAPIETTIKPWAPATTVPVPLVATSLQGNTLLALVTVQSNTVKAAPLFDDAGNVWTLATSTAGIAGTSLPREFVYYASSAAPVTTVTASFLDLNQAAVSTSGVIHVLEFTGDIGDPIGSAAGGNIGTEPTPYRVTVADGASAVIIGGLGLTVTNRVWSLVSTWTSDGHDGTRTDVDQYVAYKIVTGAASTGPTWTHTAGTQTDTTQVTVGFSGGVSLPRANAGTLQAVTTGAGVTLHGTASGGTSPYTWSWIQTKGTTAALSDTTAQDPTFTAATADTYWFQLVATDANGATSAPSTAVVVASVPMTGAPLIRIGGNWLAAPVRVRTSAGTWA